jgi:IMP dehydrogenase
MRHDNFIETLTFDDVSMVPQYSEVRSRKEPSTLVSISKDRNLEIPIVAAPMNTVCEYEMARSLDDLGGIGVIHRYMTIQDQLQQLWDFWDTDRSKEDLPFFAVGATGDFLERTEELYKNDVRKICIDVASGDSIICLEAISAIKKKFSDVLLMAGNVCTKDGYRRLARAGADMIRVGIGSGAMCKTRTVTGHGVPQLTALLWALEAKQDFPNTVLISDGGIKTSGDIVKALVIADVVMLGSLLAGTDEAPGAIIKENGEEYKLYAGMASEDGRSLNNWFDREKTSFIPEGESVRLKRKGSVVSVVNGLIGGLRVGMSYSGVSNLIELKENGMFVKITQNGQIEGTPHGKI